jgi:activator of 2-hydroxyglutaryl-CoA dehydratase
VTYFAGIDVGSLSTDVAIVDMGGKVVGYSILETGAHSTKAAEKALEMALKAGGLQRSQISKSVATGYGRISVPFVDKKVTEISCHPLDRLGDLSLRAGGEVSISSVCTVFAESEVVSLVARNHPKEEIILGLHRAIVNRVWSMVRAIGVHGAVTMSGGVAKNKGVVALMEEKLGFAVRIYSEPQIVGAIGAAILAKRHAEGES